MEDMRKEEQTSRQTTTEGRLRKVAKWAGDHKWEIAGVTACVLTGVGATVLLYRSSSFAQYGVSSVLTSYFGKNMSESVASDLVTSVTNTVSNVTETCVEESNLVREVAVEGFLRNLPETWNASAEKIAEAKAMGIELLPHQTIVDPFTKTIG